MNVSKGDTISYNGDEFKVTEVDGHSVLLHVGKNLKSKYGCDRLRISIKEIDLIVKEGSRFLSFLYMEESPKEEN